MANTTEQALNKAREALKLYADRDEWGYSSGSSHWKLLFNSASRDGHGYEAAEEALSALTAASAEAAKPVAWTYDMTPPQGFLEYVAKNYSGEVDIHDPLWHATRLWNAAMKNTKPVRPRDFGAYMDALLRSGSPTVAKAAHTIMDWYQGAADPAAPQTIQPIGQLKCGCGPSDACDICQGQPVSGAVMTDEREREMFEREMRRLSDGEPDWESPAAIWAWEAWKARSILSASGQAVSEKDAERYVADLRREYAYYSGKCPEHGLTPMSFEEYKAKADAITDEFIAKEKTR